jgi:cell division protein ZapB
MQDQTILEKLSDRVSEILQQYHAIKDENETLRNELIQEKAQRELKDQEIEKLTQENAMKDLEIEEIVNKIESILG